VASWSASLSRPYVTARFNDAATRAIPASANAGELSVTVTSSPARAATSAIPEPIKPHPTTPTFSINMPRILPDPPEWARVR